MISRVALPNNGQTYRFGFNGKENDNGVKGLGNQQDYGMRIYDPRVGRFLSVDPLSKSYPWYTPYQFAGNKPIWAVDLDGLEENTRSTYVYQAPVLATPWERAPRYNPYKEQIVVPDIHGVSVIGQRKYVTNSVASAKLQHDEVLGEQIASGPGAAIGYLVAKEPGAAVGTAFDQTAFALAGLPEEGFLSKPKSKKWVEYSPKTEEPIYEANKPARILNPSNGIGSRNSLEEYALNTEPYRGFTNVNIPGGKQNDFFDLINYKTRDVVDVTSTGAGSLNAKQFYTKLNNLATRIADPTIRTRTLQIYVKAGQYSTTQLADLSTKLRAYIKDFRLRKTTFKITQIQ
jgi:RHS repeat-associated protein